MPTNATDTASWIANVQRPNNGELADAASLAQGFNPLTQRSRFLYEISRGALFDITRAPFNADPTGALSSATAISNAALAAAAAGGHLFVPPGTFLWTGVSLPQGVSMFGVPGASYLAMNHASANGIVCTDPNDGPPSVISDIRFIGNVANTGSGVVNNADAHFVFERCSWNGFTAGGAPTSNLQGRILHSNSGLSRTEFHLCELLVTGVLKGLHVQAGAARIRGGRLVMKRTDYAEALFDVGADSYGSMRDVEVDCMAHASGTARVLYASSSTARAEMHDCPIDGSGSLGTNIGFDWIQDAIVFCSNPRKKGNVTLFGSTRAGVGSRIELPPSAAIDVGSAPTIVLTDDYQAWVIKSSATSGPAITLPLGIFPGQILALTYFNDSASAVTPSFTGTPVTGTTVPLVGAGNTLTGVFVYESRDVSGAYRWVQKGTWGVGLTLV